jgi:hypothetical protein
MVSPANSKWILAASPTFARQKQHKCAISHYINSLDSKISKISTSFRLIELQALLSHARLIFMEIHAIGTMLKQPRRPDTRNTRTNLATVEDNWKQRLDSLHSLHSPPQKPLKIGTSLRPNYTKAQPHHWYLLLRHNQAFKKRNMPKCKQSRCCYKTPRTGSW